MALEQTRLLSFYTLGQLNSKSNTKLTRWLATPPAAVKKLRMAMSENPLTAWLMTRMKPDTVMLTTRLSLSESQPKKKLPTRRPDQMEGSLVILKLHDNPSEGVASVDQKCTPAKACLLQNFNFSVVTKLAPSLHKLSACAVGGFYWYQGASNCHTGS